ncbi:MAG: class I SAM-dependent methyltransferase [Actinomycetota bacterium]
MSGSRYTYGDSEFAADRLDLVARMFEPTTRRFLERTGVSEPRLAIDLGCGPGNTTRLIADVLHPVRTVGFDRSSTYLERARRGAAPGVEFQEHDALATPFPVGPADVLFCRLLLAHLPDRADVVARWATQLTPNGVLLLDEIEDFQSDEAALVDYVRLASGVVERAGGRLVAGPELAAMPDPPGTERVVDDAVLMDVAPTDTATIFAMNLAVLVEEGEVEPQPELEGALADVAERGDGHIEWRVRQMAFRRAELR